MRKRVRRCACIHEPDAAAQACRLYDLWNVNAPRVSLPAIRGNAGARCAIFLAVVAACIGACGRVGPEPRTRAPAHTVAPEPRPVRHADFGTAHPGTEARRIADWVMDSGDNSNAPFVVIDKVAASAYVFDRDGKLLGTAPVLLGLAIGDESTPGIGDKPLSAIRTEERTTAAGRYVGELGYNLRGEDVLWVDYDTGLSLHRVLTANPRERRTQRLATPTPLDNRVSYGCINVPVRFFEDVIRPAFHDTKGMVYVLPETRSAQTVFGAYDVDSRAHREAALQTAAVSQSR